MWFINRRKRGAADRRGRSRGADMAHRRSLAAGRLMVGLLAGSVVALMMSGAVFLSNEVTGLRTGIAKLENRKCCLEAASARLQSHWNQATAPEVIVDRASREIGLIVPQEPALVLVRADQDQRSPISSWSQLLGGLGGGSEVQASESRNHVSLTELVSLVPRATAGELR